MTQNIEQRTEKAVGLYEKASCLIYDMANKDQTINTEAGQRDSHPKISREFNTAAQVQLNEQNRQFQNRFSSPSEIEWQSGKIVNNPIQAYKKIDVNGIKRVYLPNPDLIPFTTVNFEAEVSSNYWSEESVYTRMQYYRDIGDIRGWGAVADATISSPNLISAALFKTQVIFNENMTDNSPAIEEALRSCNKISAPVGYFAHSRDIMIGDSQHFIGSGRRNGTTLVSIGENGNGITLRANSRAGSIKHLSLTSLLDSNGYGLGAESDSLGFAEWKISDIEISRKYRTGIRGGDLVWENSFSNMRIASVNGIHILGTNGTSISNSFDKVYIDATGAVNPVLLKLSATKNCVFKSCNFGGTTDASGGSFVQTSSSNDGLIFMACNFELMFVADGSASHSHMDSSSVTYIGCTFIRIYGTGNQSSSTIFRSWSGCTVSLIMCNHAQTPEEAKTTDYYIDAIGATFSLYQSPDFNEPSKHRYQEYNGITPPFIKDPSSEKGVFNSINWVGKSPETKDIREKSILATEDVASYVVTEGDTPILRFDYNTPVTSGDAASIAGEIKISVATRNDGGNRISAYARFDVFANNDGYIAINKVSMMASQGSRQLEIGLKSVDQTLVITLTSNVGSVAGGQLNVKYDFVKSIYDGYIDSTQEPVIYVHKIG